MADIPPRPVSANFFGVFVAVTFVDPWDFNTGHKPQIDAAAAIGANFIVFAGEATDVPAGVLTEAQWLGRHRQVVEYLASKGMYGLIYGVNTRSQWGGSITNTQMCEVLAANAAMVSKYPHMVGYVTEDEPYISGNTVGNSHTTDATLVSEAAAQYAAVRAVVPPDFPVCCAPFYGNTPFAYTGADKTRIDNMAPYCDFFAFHPFYAATLAESSALRAAYPGKQILLPSTVAATNNTGITAKISATMGLTGSNGFRGTGYFLGIDFYAPGMGLFNDDYTNRTARTGPFTAGISSIWPKHPIRPFRGKPRLNALRRWNYV